MRNETRSPFSNDFAASTKHRPKGKTESGEASLCLNVINIMMIKLGGNKRKWIFFIFAFLSVSLAAGLVYGWPALRQDLRDDGSTLSEKELGAIFTAGSWSTQGGRFLTGVARDRYGTRIVTCGAILCCAAGSLGIALSDVNNGLALGASLLFVGLGSGIQLCLQPVAGLFPKHAGAILSTLSGGFQISGLVFLMLTSISDERSISFLGFVVCLLALAVIAMLLLPRGRSFVLETDETLETGEDEDAAVPNEAVSACGKMLDDTSVVSVEGDTDDPNFASDGNQGEKETTSAAGNDDEPGALQQMRSLEYLGLATWFSILLVPLQYYVGSLGFQLEARGDDNGFYTDLFSILYASAAVVAPAAGYLADKYGLGIAQGFSTLLVSVALFILASTRISLDAHAVGLGAYGVGRMLIFGTFFTNVGKRFGFSNYGTLAGLGLLTSALVSLLQYPLIVLASNRHDTAVNVACGAVLVCMLPYCAWLCRQERRYPNGARYA